MPSSDPLMSKDAPGGALTTEGNVSKPAPPVRQHTSSVSFYTENAPDQVRPPTR
eukprot:CAMPEP_0174707350 /NCGR_PEP_ID=MMETSP1094-20130205/9889_1 /TAXON_ID=156173 /ORGANISM="Chrysochromulina brevifilum, Strain UTEX LB 985" /LENGTH=53 /DNA_ID=CAMNT_0015905713 /DNA_START=130 /DNA_END=287 /DNA_ORIENTATION=-